MANCQTNETRHILFSQNKKSFLKQSTILSFLSSVNINNFNATATVDDCHNSFPRTEVTNETTQMKVNSPNLNANCNTFKGPNSRNPASRFGLAKNIFLSSNLNNIYVVNMKAKQGVNKEDNTPEKGVDDGSSGSIDRLTNALTKRRGRRKGQVAPVAAGNDKSKNVTDDPGKSKGTLRKVLQRGPKKVLQRRAILVKKNIRNKKALISKENIKISARQVSAKKIKKSQDVKCKKPQDDSKTEEKTDSQENKSQDPSDNIPEPGPSEVVGSGSSSPKSTNFARRQRLSSDLIMMKSLLGDAPTSIISSGKSPYSTRSDRSRSPLVIKDKEPPMKTLRNGKQRKQKTSLLNETVEQAFKRRRRLLSDSRDKGDANVDSNDETKKRRVRSFSRDGSEISKCSEFTESDLSFCETMSVDADSIKTVESNKDARPQTASKENKSNSSNSEILSITDGSVKVKSEPLDISEKVIEEKRRSTSMDSENNNAAKAKLSAAVKIEVNADISDKSLILDNMSKAFNETPLSKIRRSKRQRKSTVKAKEQEETVLIERAAAELDITKTIKQEEVESTSAEDASVSVSDSETTNAFKDSSGSLSVGQFYGSSEKLINNSEVATEIIQNVVDKTSEILNTNILPSLEESVFVDENSKKSDDCESLKLHFEEDDGDSDEKTEESSKENIESVFTAKRYSNQDIDVLINKLRTFEEEDRKRQQELLAKSTSKTPMMVTNDVVLIAKSGTEIKPLKDIQSTVQSIDIVEQIKPIDKDSVLSCFENNSAISIVKKDHIRRSSDKDHLRKSVDKEQIRKSIEKEVVRKSTEKDYGMRKSIDIDLPCSITLIPRTGGSRKQSTCSNSSENLITLEKALIKEKTLEARKSVDKVPLNECTKVSISKESPKIVPFAENATCLSKASSNTQLKLSAGDIVPSITIVPTPIVVSAAAVVSAANIIPATTILATSVGSTTTIATTVVPVLTILPHISNKIAVTTENVLTVPDIVKDIIIPIKQPLLETTTLLTNEDKVLVKNITKALDIKLETDSVDAEQHVQTAAEEKITANDKDSPSLNEIAVENKLDKKSLDSDSALHMINKDGSVSQVANAIISMTKETLKESPEKQKQKESILRTLGLLTLKAADEAKIEKQKQKELLANKGNKSSLQKIPPNDSYTGTLKTVIKINRSSDKKKPGRSSLKMTFQKSKGRPARHVLEGISGESDSDDNPYYTIHKEFGDPSIGGTAPADHASTGGHRKSHYSNRFNIHDLGATEVPGEAVTEATAGKEPSLNLVIPEKASSFSIHPGRLCQDQCFYCGGKFGLFDTPCHVAQIKSTERQKKILDNEEKLTVDSCLCDACYRHVDRRANCPSYRKRLAPVVPPSLASASILPQNVPSGPPGSICHAEKCSLQASHSIRRKWLIKMRKSVNKVVALELDYPGLHTIPLCEEHYQNISRLMVCGLCTRRLSKNHVHFINQEYPTLNPLLDDNKIPVKFEEKTMVCKLCRYFCTLLLKPPTQTQVNKKAFLKSYRKRLLLSHNIEPPEESESDQADEPTVSDEKSNIDTPEIIEESGVKEKKKTKVGKIKTKKLSESSKHTDENSSESNKDKDNKEKEKDDHEKAPELGQTSMDEDIESLISSNKIPIPGTTSNSKQSDDLSMVSTEISDNSDIDMLADFEASIVPTFDNQSDLQYLLQKQNTPSAYLKSAVPNLTQKSKNIIKMQNANVTNRTHNQKVMDKNAKRIQKLGQIITQKTDSPPPPVQKPMTEFTIESISENGSEKISTKDIPNLNILRNIALNDECTIESIPSKSTKPPSDIHSLKNKWQMTESFSQIKKNLNELSKNLSSEQLKKKSVNQESKYTNPVRRLETNPSISVRELFPGEEEMNLQCNIEFNNVKTVTPEGWEKCNSTIQYDNDTKKLWHDLQKPYGNQSSFLRHLILLERYFRNGDLILSQNANCSAVTYSESVQNRLRAYDNIPSNPSSSKFLVPKPCTPATITITPQTSSSDTSIETNKKSDSNNSLIEFRKQKSGISGKSLLKTNNSSSEMSKLTNTIMLSRGLQIQSQGNENVLPILNQAKIPKNVPMSLAQLTQSIDTTLGIPKLPKNMPVSLTPIEKMPSQIGSSNGTASNNNSSMVRPGTPKPEMMKPIPPFSLSSSLTIESKLVPAKSDMSKTRNNSLPPELIAINSQNTSGRKSIENVLKNIQQLAKNAGAASQPIISAAQSPIIPMTTVMTSAHSLLPPLPVTCITLPQLAPVAPTFSIMPSLPLVTASTSATPESDKPTTSKGSTPKKMKTGTKSWRPTLIPITDETKAKANSHDVLYQTADGRRLPSLVQVMSGGKPYHITIQDYNKMCILRREKLQQLQKAELLKGGTSTSKTSKLSSQSDVPLELNTLTENSSTEMSEPLLLSDNLASENNMPSIINGSNMPKQDNNERNISPTSDNNPASILKNVGLKNITIAPVTSASMIENKIKSTPIASPPQSMLIPSSAKNFLQLPASIAQLGPAVSVTAETVLKTSSPMSIARPLPVASHIMPKIPKSLTVIPQTVLLPVETSSSSNVPIMTSSMTVSGGFPAMAILPIPAAQTSSQKP